jgi:hypothetical protein
LTTSFRTPHRHPSDYGGGTLSEAFVVPHFDDPHRQWGSTSMGNAVTDRGFVFDQVETVSSIWLLDRSTTSGGTDRSVSGHAP